ncbi:MAG: transposase, partial [Bacteroidota bacterium]|nr:transposase [Bacteroidota bacterium]
MKLTLFKEIDFLNAVKALFHELKVPMNYVSDEPTTITKILSPLTYRENYTFNLVDDVYFVGMVDDAAFEGNQSLSASQIKSDYDGVLIFGITLNQRDNNLLPTRSQLAEISRAFNREFYYTPVVLVFKYHDNISDYLAFANTERLKYKQEWREGEKAGKVSLLRDINIKKPHRGHEDIINQLKIPTSGTKQVDTFAKLYNYWQEVFSVSILNKKFYQELQNWYFWAIKEVSFPNQPKILDENIDGDEAKLKEAIKEHKGKNVIRLLTRILFIWFIKEKKLIPEEIFDEQTIGDKLIDDFTPQKPHGIFSTGKHNSKYYRAILQNLFFATLNKEMGKREFRKDKQHQNVTNLMRYQSYFKNPDYFVQLMEDIVPFMNGGLFECLDKPHETIKGKKGGDKIIYIDGFSDRLDNTLVVPDYLFFDVDEDVDLSDDFGSKAKVYKNAKTKGLLEILKSYKFTITENTPIEEDVALDPELLGKVFENLLASYNPETKTTARKQTGSFYTPREIVNYMVDESLIAYLKNVLEASNFDISDGLSTQYIDKTGNVFFNPNDEIEIKEGKLPHWQQKEVFYHVTFRLADSIPKEKAEQLKIDRENWQKKNKDKKDYSKDEWKEYNRLFNERVEQWMNAGYGSCLLKKKENATIVANAIKYFAGDRYILDEWVVMPNHVHVLVKPIADNKLSNILHSWKSFTANEINKFENLSGQLWMHESYDHIVRNEDALKAIRHYIRQNPTKANIVVEASSFNTSRNKDVSSFNKDQSKDALDTMLHQLFSFDETNPFKNNPEIQSQIIKALDKAKILDPAAGSGAFPMGVLQKMVHILQKLDSDNELCKEVQLEKAMAETEDAYGIENKKEREQKLIEINNAFDEKVNDPDFARKLYLIENCIYGVDIQPIATQISKLRFFISLVVDQKVQPDEPNFGIRPLPNLETRFVTANTLIGIQKENSLFYTDEVKKLENKLKKVRHKLFNARTKDTKLKYRQKDEELRHNIADILKDKGLPLYEAEKLANWDPYDQNASSPFFDPEWMFDIKSGFDVVIGNPPYIGEKGNKDIFRQLAIGSLSKRFYQRKIDIFYFFFHLALDTLKERGTFSFITTNYYPTADAAKNLRNDLKT